MITLFFFDITGIRLDYGDVLLLKDLIKLKNKAETKAKNLTGKKLTKELISNINNYLLGVNKMFSLGIKNQIDENELINAITAGYKDIFVAKRNLT